MDSEKKKKKVIEQLIAYDFSEFKVSEFCKFAKITRQYYYSLYTIYNWQYINLMRGAGGKRNGIPEPCTLDHRRYLKNNTPGKVYDATRHYKKGRKPGIPRFLYCPYCKKEINLKSS